MYKKNGFTLVELMIAVVILAVLTMIAFPSYMEYGRRADEARVQQQLQNLAVQLERHKARQFNYLGFVAGGTTPIIVPAGATGAAIKYKVYIRDGGAGNPILTSTAAGVTGFSWVMKAEAESPRLNNYLLTSAGLQCKNKASIDYSGCGLGGGAW